MQKFKTYLQGKGLSPATIRQHQRQAGLFGTWYGSNELINCRKKDILDYLSYLKNTKKLQVTTRNHVLLSLRHYFDSLMNDTLTASNPTALIKLRGLNKRKLPHVYTPEELTELVDNYYLLEVKQVEEKMNLPERKARHRDSYLARIRNYVMLQFFAYQGVNTREILQLRTDDIQLHKATVTIPKGIQRGNARTLPLNAAQMGALMQYLNEVRPQLANPDGYILFTPLKQKNGASAANIALVKLSAQLKRIDRNFSNLAQLRASVITHWIKTYGLRKAQYMAGHKSIVSTEEYLPNHIEDLADDMTKFNPF
ncbi:MAG: phage integrase N-terminal SAM-like domain-containing protein [Tannerella sp.]|jgi:site-specific recombinase XerD|nr:phage integrase N-terminal SAM-like domain-containing protein [Tannerella sp.]